MTAYYDVQLKRQRQQILRAYPLYHSHEFLLEENDRFQQLIAERRPEVVLHLAAQAGVRYSIQNPRAYIDANLVGTFNVLEGCRATPVKHLLLASTSSAYGGNTEMPFRETDRTVLPLTLYAASKLATEHMAHAYSHLFGIPTTVYRFFTVYGPWGRPDMALFLFVKNILAGQPIEVFNNGESKRDFTYVDDLIEGIVRLISCVPVKPADRSGSSEIVGDTLSPVSAFRLVNIGGGRPVGLNAFIDEIEAALGRRAERIYRPLQPGDVPETTASADLLGALTGFRPSTPISIGVRNFVSWYRDHYGG